MSRVPAEMFDAEGNYVPSRDRRPLGVSCTCPAGSYDPGNVHTDYCALCEVQGGLDAVYHPDAIRAAMEDSAEANAPEPQLGVKARKLARFDLLPFDVLWEVAEVLGWGATNRGNTERNWEQGLVAGDCIAGIFRHVSQWASGEQEDEDTGKSHLAHAICLLMFLRGLEMRGRLVDDRPEPFGPLRSETLPGR